MRTWPLRQAMSSGLRLSHECGCKVETGKSNVAWSQPTRVGTQFDCRLQGLEELGLMKGEQEYQD